VTWRGELFSDGRLEYTLNVQGSNGTWNLEIGGRELVAGLDDKGDIRRVLLDGKEDEELNRLLQDYAAR